MFLFNPVDCRSLGVIRTTLESMAKGEILEVTANGFQHREIEALMKKLKHRVVEIVDEVGQLKIYIEKHGLVAPSPLPGEKESQQPLAPLGGRGQGEGSA